MPCDMSFYVGRNRTLRLILGSPPRTGRFAVILTGWYAFAFAACYLDDALRLPSPHVGLLRDVVMATLYPALLFVVWTALRLLQRLEDLLSHLPSIVQPPAGAAGDGESAALSEDVKWARRVVALDGRRARRWHGGMLAAMCLLVLVFQVAIPFLAPQAVRAWPLWPQRHAVAYTFGVAWALFYWVLVVGNVLWIGSASAYAVFRLMRRYTRAGRLVIVPVAPDGQGGLAALGSFSFTLTRLVAGGMAFVVAWVLVFGIDLPLLIGAAVYLLVLTAFFFGPLVSVHWAMREAKDKELARLAALFRAEYVDLPSAEEVPRRGDHDARTRVEGTMRYLARLDQLYRRAEGMPVWPFNVSTLAQFFTLVVVPLVLFIVQLMTQNALTRLLRMGLE